VVAAALGRLLGTVLDITLVESDEIGTIGVGESTIPTSRTFHHLLGIDERAFVRETQSSFKLGILFENWSAIGDRYIHSFGQIGRSTWMGDFHHLWLQAREAGFGGDLGDYCFELKRPKPAGSPLRTRCRSTTPISMPAATPASCAALPRPTACAGSRARSAGSSRMARPAS
jgi:hypothetical protein